MRYPNLPNFSAIGVRMKVANPAYRGASMSGVLGGMKSCMEFLEFYPQEVHHIKPQRFGKTPNGTTNSFVAVWPSTGVVNIERNPSARFDQSGPMQSHHAIGADQEVPEKSGCDTGIEF